MNECMLNIARDVVLGTWSLLVVPKDKIEGPWS